MKASKRSKQYAARIKPAAVKDILSGDFVYMKDLAQKWNVASNTISVWAKEVGYKFEDPRTIKHREKLAEMEPVIPYLGKWADTDIAERFNFHPTRVRSLREGMHIPSLHRKVFMSREYRKARLEFLAKRVTEITIDGMLQSWGRSKELNDYVEELRCASTASRLASR